MEKDSASPPPSALPDALQAERSSATDSKRNIAFSLSESSFALYPPIEPHEGDFPAMSQPMLNSLPLIADASLTNNPQQESLFLTDDSNTANHARGLMAARLGVRGDSYAYGINLLEENPDARLSQLMLGAALSYPPPPHKYGPIVIVSSYTQFSSLAHGPRGTEAMRALRTYRLNILDGSLTLLSMTPEGKFHNPAFTRRHPTHNVVYACTESVQQEGQVIAFVLDGRTGALTEYCPSVGAGGTSTCYLTISKSGRRLLLVNYWDSTICTLELGADGKLGKRLAIYDPKEGKKMKASAASRVPPCKGCHFACLRPQPLQFLSWQELTRTLITGSHNTLSRIGECGHSRQPLAKRRRSSGREAGRSPLSRNRARADHRDDRLRARLGYGRHPPVLL